MHQYTFIYDDEYMGKDQIYTKNFEQEKTAKELKSFFEKIPWVFESFAEVVALHTIVQNKPTGALIWSSKERNN